MDQNVAVKTPSALFRLLLLLSVTTGMIDAASILGMGKVFTANMTGNVVFLGFASAGQPGYSPAPYVIALVAFMTGALTAGRLWRAPGLRVLRDWLVMAAMIETALLLAAAFVAGIRPDEHAPRTFLIIALTASAMGFRNAIVRELKVPDLTTTVLTLTITGIASDSRLASGSAPNRGARFGSVFMIFAGAGFGAAAMRYLGLAPTLALIGGLVFLGTIIFARGPSFAQIRRP